MTVPSSEESSYRLVVQHGPVIAPDATWNNHALNLVNDDCLPRNVYFYMELDGPIIPDNSVVVLSITISSSVNDYFWSFKGEKFSDGLLSLKTKYEWVPINHK